VLAACRAHTRRKLYDVAEATGWPVAAEALRRIGELYAIASKRACALSRLPTGLQAPFSIYCVVQAHSQ
jgi:Transposase IS66 family